MEVAVAKALKPSLRGEFIVQQTPLYEEFLCLNANTVGGGEDFFVDDLLDFSNGEGYDEEKESVSVSSQSQDRGEDDSNSNSTGVSYDSFFSTELAVPAGDLEDLEWVSHFVDDSLPELSLLYPVRSVEANRWVEPDPSAKKTPRFPWEMKITTKARTVRNRKPNARVWSLGLGPCSRSRLRRPRVLLPRRSRPRRSRRSEPRPNPLEPRFSGGAVIARCRRRRSGGPAH
ncbi:GATA transcription factor 5 [Spatholobus suberectus]|nr:GATA transcription factor 5 [Spatholobus suberectus]